MPKRLERKVWWGWEGGNGGWKREGGSGGWRMKEGVGAGGGKEGVGDGGGKEGRRKRREEGREVLGATCSSTSHLEP